MGWLTNGDPELPAILLLHGFLGHGQDMSEIAAELSGLRRAVMPDLPGHGRETASRAPADYTVEATAAGLVRCMSRAGIDRADLLGYSLGGRVALHAALAHPDRFPRLVLESASAGLADPGARRERRALDRRRAAALRADGVDAFLRDWYAQSLFASLRERPELLRPLVDDPRSPDAEGLALSLEQMGTGGTPSLWDRLPELRRPVLLVCGSRDAKFTALNREMAERLPNARLAVVEGAGHNVHLEAPARFGRLVREFLAV